MTDVIRRVFVITFCRDLELLYGSTLVFESLRMGFPEAEVYVLDNGSLEDAVPVLRAVVPPDVSFVVIPPQPHHTILRLLLEGNDAPFAVVDPDVVFWGRADSLGTGLVEGRLIPEFKDPYTQCTTQARLHTSFLKFNDPAALKRRIQDITTKCFEWDPIAPVMVQRRTEWLRYDTCASLWTTLGDECRAFGDSENALFDHLFCGSHVDLVAPHMGDFADEVLRTHQDARLGRVSKLRGIRKVQDSFFEAHSV